MMPILTDQAPAPSPDGPPGRVGAVDAVRVAVIVMVIVHHAAQAYGPTGGAWPVSDTAQSDWFRPFYTVNAAVGLGLLFFLAGYLVPRAYDRKGPGRFLRDRWLRIGLPLVFFVLLVHLPLAYLYEGKSPGEFLTGLYEDGLQPIYLHLWFLAHLILYSAVYVLWRRRAERTGRPHRVVSPPGNRTIATYIVALAVLTWIVRWWFPVDEWIPLLFVMPAEPANILQYTSLFAFGIMASRGDWVRRMPRRVGVVWLGVGLAAAGAVYALEALGEWGDLVATGGVDWRALVRTGLEAPIAGGLCVGLLVMAREAIPTPRRLLAGAAAASYAAYILHLWIVVGLQMAILDVALPVLVKFVGVAVFGVLLSFGLGHLSGKVPGLRVVLGTMPRRVAQGG